MNGSSSVRVALFIRESGSESPCRWSYVTGIYTYRKLNRQRSVFPSDTALLKALYLSTFEATKKWTMPIRNWGQVYGELSIMYEGRLPE